jgi:hypothetical protein
MTFYFKYIHIFLYYFLYYYFIYNMTTTENNNINNQRYLEICNEFNE